MIAVDTNILIDIFTSDPNYGALSAKTLRHCMQHHGICVCEVVFAETAGAFNNQDAFTKAMQELNIDFVSMTQDASLIAARIWRQYRKAGGKKHYMIPDFLIGAHAMEQCEGLITRDRGFFKQYFKSLNIIDPTKEL